MTPLAEVARAMFSAAVETVRPASLIKRLKLDAGGVSFEGAGLRPAGRLVLVALGKAAPELASEFLKHSPRAPDEVFVLAPRGVDTPPAVAPLTRLGRHPLPDERGELATRELLELLAGLASEDGVILLLSGGTSALLALPLEGVERETITDLTRELLAAGAPIGELNCVRKHLLAATGGRLATATLASIFTLVLSDVPGDDLATIASGPTVPDPTTFSQALEIVARRGLADRFADVDRLLRAGARGALAESPKPGDPGLARSQVRLVGGNREALAGAAAVARAAGFTPAVLTRTLRGEAREIGATLAHLSLAAATGEALALLAAGETTVTVRGAGRGGRNLELALAAAQVLQGTSGRCLLAAGTDGVDGQSPAAGAVVDGATVGRAEALGREAHRALEQSDSWGFFEGLPEAILTGPTGTNVADVAFVLLAGAPRSFVAGRAARGAAVEAALG